MSKKNHTTRSFRAIPKQDKFKLIALLNYAKLAGFRQHELTSLTRVLIAVRSVCNLPALRKTEVETVSAYFEQIFNLPQSERDGLAFASAKAKGFIPEPPQPKPQRPQKKKKKVRAKVITDSRPSNYIKARNEFYESWDWRTARYKFLKDKGPRCMCCGSAAGDYTVGGTPVRIVVDHIKPLYTHWHLRLDEANFQILCDECNQGKGAWDKTDHRPVVQQ